MKIVFDKFVANPKLKNSFLEGFVKNLTYIEKYDDDIKRAAYRYTVPAETVNLQGSMHGGALSTLVDIVTTITILKSTPLRNASINLSTQFLSPAKIHSQLIVQTYIKKLGKSIVFTDCQIFHDNKLIAKGIHTKAFAKQNWQFM